MLFTIYEIRRKPTDTHVWYRSIFNFLRLLVYWVLMGTSFVVNGLCTIKCMCTTHCVVWTMITTLYMETQIFFSLHPNAIICNNFLFIARPMYTIWAKSRSSWISQSSDAIVFVGIFVRSFGCCGTFLFRAFRFQFLFDVHILNWCIVEHWLSLSYRTENVTDKPKYMDRSHLVPGP